MDKEPSNAWSDRRKEGAPGRSIFLIKELVYGLLNLETLGDRNQALPDSEGRKKKSQVDQSS